MNGKMGFCFRQIDVLAFTNTPPPPTLTLKGLCFTKNAAVQADSFIFTFSIVLIDVREDGLA